MNRETKTSVYRYIVIALILTGLLNTAQADTIYTTAELHFGAMVLDNKHTSKRRVCASKLQTVSNGVYIYTDIGKHKGYTSSAKHTNVSISSTASLLPFLIHEYCDKRGMRYNHVANALSMYIKANVSDGLLYDTKLDFKYNYVLTMLPLTAKPNDVDYSVYKDMGPAISELVYNTIHAIHRTDIHRSYKRKYRRVLSNVIRKLRTDRKEYNEKMHYYNMSKDALAIKLSTCVKSGPMKHYYKQWECDTIAMGLTRRIYGVDPSVDVITLSQDERDALFNKSNTIMDSVTSNGKLGETNWFK